MSKRMMACVLAVITLITALIPATALARDELSNTDPSRYYIVLDTGNQVVTVYEQDDNGEYTRIVRRMVCTSGKTEAISETEPASPTPTGTWKIGARERFGKFAAFGAEYARYWTQIVGGIYFHSIMFGSREVDDIKKGPFSRLGSRASHGCVRLYVEDAKWLYYNACPGTTVRVTSGIGENRNLVKLLKTDMSFDEYAAFQQNIYDEPELPNSTAWIVSDRAEMRTGNGTNDKRIRSLGEGTEVEVLQEGDPWVKILVGGREGYVKRCYITYEQGVLQSTPEGNYVSGTIYMYEQPDRRSTVLYKVARDSSLVIVERGEDYTLIDYWGTLGYIQTRYIKTGWATLYDWADEYTATQTDAEISGTDASDTDAVAADATGTDAN